MQWTRAVCPLFQILIICLPVFAADRAVEWPFANGDQGGTHYSALTEINTSNVAQLKQAWVWKTGEVPIKEFSVRPGMFENTPLMIDNILYVLTTPYNKIVALDAESKRPPSCGPTIRSLMWTAIRPKRLRLHCISGIAMWRDGNTQRIFLNTRYRLISIDAKTGKPDQSFGDNGIVDLSQGLVWPINKLHYTNTSPPVVYKKPGDCRQRRGRLAWCIKTIRPAMSARLRCPHGKASLVVSYHPTIRRIRQQKPGARIPREIYGPYQCMGAHHA